MPVTNGPWFGGGFFIGMFVLKHARHFSRSCISVNVLRKRRSVFYVNDWLMDSGAFTEVTKYGRHRYSCKEYAGQIDKWSQTRSLLSAVSQDYMCEPFVLRRTGLEVGDHQLLTIKRYDELMSLGPSVPIMPVLQGYEPNEYVSHVRQYGKRLVDGMWVGVGSVCKRNSTPNSVYGVLHAIRRERPDLKLHGFGLKVTSLGDAGVLRCLWSADSMAWSRAARYEGRDANGLEEAQEFWDKVTGVVNKTRF